MHIDQTPRVHIFIINKQILGLIFDFVHYLHHLHLLQINGYERCLCLSSRGRKTKESYEQRDYQTF